MLFVGIKGLPAFLSLCVCVCVFQEFKFTKDPRCGLFAPEGGWNFSNKKGIQGVPPQTQGLSVLLQEINRPWHVFAIVICHRCGRFRFVFGWVIRLDMESNQQQPEGQVIGNNDWGEGCGR